VTIDAKHAAASAVSSHHGGLIELSSEIHAHPETAWEEYRACGWVSNALAEQGFSVIPSYLGLETSFRASYGSGPFRVGLMAEYDALPGLGHACGHNIIAATAVGAALGLQKVADELGLTVEVYGTPAEEGGGGKIEMIDRGAFEGLDLAMMAHPGPVDVALAQPFAVAHNHVIYHGKSAHAGAYPANGVNANDAFVIAQVALGLLRQQLPPSVRVHGVMTHGGDAPNAIPDRTEGRWYVRAETSSELEDLLPRIEHCFEAGALASGCSLEIKPESKPYSEFRNDESALESYRANAIALGRIFDVGTTFSQMNRASTDMGNVSQLIPAIHPYIGIDSAPATNHQPEFAAACIRPAAEVAIIDGAVALAWTAIDQASNKLNGSSL
jgi:amidohydrolase